MPYAPGITDISGQILAQGMVERSRGISAGIENFIKGYEQNQMLKKQAMSTFAGAAAADPDLLKFLNEAQQADIQGTPGGQKVPPEVLKAYARAQKGDLDLYDASILGNFAGTYQKTKSEAQQRQLQAAQLAQAQAQANRLTQETEEAKKSQEYFQNLMAGNQPQMQAAAPAQQMGQQPAVPAAVPYYLARPGAPAPAQPPMQAIQAVQAAQGQPDQGAPTERDAAIKLFAATGRRPTPAQVVSELRVMNQEYRKNVGAEQAFRTPQQASVAANQLNATLPRGTVATIDQGTDGLYRIKTVASSTELPEQSTARQEEEQRIKATGKMAEADVASGASARKIAVPVLRLSKLVSEEGLQTGQLEEFKLAARGIGKAVGLPIDENKLAQGNEALAYMGQLLLPVYAEQKGAISNKEQALYQSMTPSMQKDPQANARLLKVIAARIETDRKLEQNAAAFNAGDINSREFQKARQRILNAFDDSIPDLADLEKKVAAVPVTQTATAPAAGSSNTIGKYKILSVRP